MICKLMIFFGLMVGAANMSQAAQVLADDGTRAEELQLASSARSTDCSDDALNSLAECACYVSHATNTISEHLRSNCIDYFGRGVFRRSDACASFKVGDVLITEKLNRALTDVRTTCIADELSSILDPPSRQLQPVEQMNAVARHSGGRTVLIIIIICP
eukprot:GFKZ01009653.1.p1 GENE.GFKZ01009653.1~~GFKZ01009653.1.p1  ORF type:complete len:159 (+),score=23.41 GFKZ01009653.1:157-633(+)